MDETEYREMYTEHCAELGARPTDRGFLEFKAWRKKVEAVFEEHNSKVVEKSDAAFIKKSKKT